MQTNLKNNDPPNSDKPDNSSLKQREKNLNLRKQELDIARLEFELNHAQREKNLDLRKQELDIARLELEYQVRESEHTLLKNKDWWLSVHQHTKVILSIGSLIGGIYFISYGQDIGLFLLGSGGTAGFSKLPIKDSSTDNSTENTYLKGLELQFLRPAKGNPVTGLIISTALIIIGFALGGLTLILAGIGTSLLSMILLKEHEL